MSKYLGYEQTGFANSTVSITRASSSGDVPVSYSNTVHTTLYLPFNDDVNDDSPFSQTITNRGSVTVDSTYTKFGSNALKSQTSGSLKIDNSSSTDLDGSFTVEFFFYITTSQSQTTLYVHNENNSSYSGLLFWITSAGNFNAYSAESGSWNIFSTKQFASSVTTGTWHHVAITYDGTTYRGFYDGDRKWEVTNSTTLPTGGDHYIFSRNDGGQYQPATGEVYMDDFRVTKGKALYTDSTYTVPTSALGIEQDHPVSLYLPFDSDIQDDSSHSHTVTASGSATISSTQSKFGGNSLSLNGTDQYLTFPNHSTFQFGTEDFTIEAWVYQSTAAGGDAADRHNVVSRMDSSSNRSWSLDIRNETQQKIVFGFTSNGSNSTEIKFDCDVPVGSWHHVAIVRSKDNLFAFLDGISLSGTVTGHLSSFSSSVDFYDGTSDLTVGHRGLSNQFFEGYIDDLRISKGVARYTKNFIPPSQAVGATLNGTNETNTTTDFTTLYLPFDSDLQDDSSSSHSVTATGGAAISSAQSKFGGYSALFDGTNDYLSIPSSSDFNFDSDFTIECFIYPNNNNNYMLIAHRASSVNFTLEMHRNTTGDIEFFAGSFSGTNPVISTTISGGFTGAWHHVAVTRIGDVFRLFFDGELKSTVTQSSVTFNTSAELRIGADNHPSIGSRFFFNGYIDDFRILTGYAKYTADFVPPTTAVTTSVSQTENDLTVLYMPFDSDSFEDQARNHSITKEGTAALNTSVKKFGTSSLFVDGNSDYLSIPAGSFPFGNEDFTIEAWVYNTEGSSDKTLFDFKSGTNDGFEILVAGSPNKLRYRRVIDDSGNHSPNNLITSGALGINAWKHIAITRSHGTARMFIDGTLQNSASDTAPYGNNSGAPGLTIGAKSDGSQGFPGYIDDLRVIIGHAKYTEAFTPPTSAHGHVSLTESQITSETYSDTKFLSGVWNLRDAESKIQDGEWIRNDSDTGSVPSGLIIKGAGLEAAGHRWYVAPTSAPGVEILAVGAGGDGGNNQKSGGNTVFTHSGTGEYILAVGGGSAGPAGGGVGRAGGGGGGFVTATDLILDKDVSYTLTVGASGAVTESPLPSPSPAYPGGSGGGGTYVSGGVGRAGGTGVQPSTPQPLISGIPGASNFQNLGYDGAAHPPNGDNPGADQGPARGGGGGGTASSISGTSLTYGGGGYSGNRGGPTSGLANAGPGGSGNSGSGNGGPGTRGGGGGGAGASGPTGGSGGPGVFVIAYPDSENTLTITGTLSYVLPSRSGYRVYYFTSGTGTITLSD